jgi:TP901 family phage tail tape measure protein
MKPNESERIEFGRVVKAVDLFSKSIEKAAEAAVTLTDHDLDELIADVKKNKINLGAAIYKRPLKEGFDAGKSSFDEAAVRKEFRSLGPIIAPTAGTPETFQEAVINRNLVETRKRFLLPKNLKTRLGLVDANLEGQDEGEKSVTFRIKDESGNVLKTISRTLVESDDKVKGFTEHVNDLNEAFANRTTLQMAFKRVLLWSTAGATVFGMVSAFQAAVQAITETEVKMVELQKVMNPATTNFGRLRKEAVEFSKQFGQPVGEVLGGFVTFAKQGLSEQDVAEKGRVSALAANVSENLKAAEATEILTSASLQFAREGKKPIEILDAMVEVANRFAVDEKQLGQALERSGAAADAAGVSFSQLLGITTALSEVTRKSGNETGTFNKFLFRSIYRPKSEKALSDVGISVKNNSGDLRSAFDILGELANKFSGLTTAQQQSVAEAIVGSRRYNDLLIILTHWDRVNRAVTASQESQGSSMRKNEVVMGSFAKQLEVLRVSMTDVVLQFGDVALRFATPFVKAVSSIVSAFASLPNYVKVSVVALTGLLLTVNKYTEIKDSLARIGVSLTNPFKGFTGALGGGLIKLLELIPSKFASAQVAAALFALTVSGTGGKIVEAAKNIGASLLGLTKFSSGEEAFSGVNKRVESLRDESQAFSDLLSKSQQISNLKSKAQVISKLSPEEINQRIEEQRFESPASLASKALKDQNELVNEIAKRNVELVDHYDAQGNAVLKNNNLLTEQLTIMSQISSEALSIAQLDVTKGLARELSGASDSIRLAIKSLLSAIPVVGAALYGFTKKLPIPGIGGELSPTNRLQDIIPKLNKDLKLQAAGDFTLNPEIQSLQEEVDKAKADYSQLVLRFNESSSSILKQSPETIRNAFSSGDLREGLKGIATTALASEGALNGTDLLTAKRLIDERTLEELGSRVFSEAAPGIAGGRRAAGALAEGGILPLRDEQGNLAQGSAEVRKSDLEGAYAFFSRDIANAINAGIERGKISTDEKGNQVLTTLDKSGQFLTVTLDTLSSAAEKASDSFLTVFPKVARQLDSLFEDRAKVIDRISEGAGFGVSFPGGLNLGATRLRELDPQVQLFKELDKYKFSVGGSNAKNLFEFTKIQDELLTQQRTELGKTTRRSGAIEDTTGTEGELKKLSKEQEAQMIELQNTIAINKAVISLSLELQKLKNSLVNLSEEIQKRDIAKEIEDKFVNINLQTGNTIRSLGDLGTRREDLGVLGRALDQGPLAEFVKQFDKAKNTLQDTAKTAEAVSTAKFDFNAIVKDFTDAGIFSIPDLKTLTKEGPDAVLNREIDKQTLRVNQQALVENQSQTGILRQIHEALTGNVGQRASKLEEIAKNVEVSKVFPVAFLMETKPEALGSSTKIEIQFNRFVPVDELHALANSFAAKKLTGLISDNIMPFPSGWAPMTSLYAEREKPTAFKNVEMSVPLTNLSEISKRDDVKRIFIVRYDSEIKSGSVDLDSD